MNTANIGRRKTVPIVEPAPSVDDYFSDEPQEMVHAPLPVIPQATHAAPPKPEPHRDREKEAVGLLRALFDLAEHSMTAAEMVAHVPEAQMGLLYEKARAAYEFSGFVFDAAAKRQKGVA